MVWGKVLEYVIQGSAVGLFMLAANKLLEASKIIVRHDTSITNLTSEFKELKTSLSEISHSIIESFKEEIKPVEKLGERVTNVEKDITDLKIHTQFKK